MDLGPFLARQESHSATKRRRMLNKQILEEVERRKAKHMKASMGASSTIAFKQELVRKFGNVPRAWRTALDLDGNGRLSRNEFFGAARALGYSGNLKDLWAELDEDGSGFIALRELDPESHEYLTTFRALLNAKFGNTLQAWLKYLDKDKNGRLDLAEFTERLQGLGFQLSAKKLFNLLMKDAYKPYLSLPDVDPLAYEALERGDLEMLTVSKDHGADGTTTSSRRQLQVAKQTIEENKRKHTEDLKKNIGAKTVGSFIAHLKLRFGHVPRAWRCHLDADGNGRLSRNEFFQAARATNYVGNLKTLWDQLDADQSGFITLNELDPEAHTLIEDFFGLMRRKFGHTLRAWGECFDREGNGQCDKLQFLSRCEEIGYQHDAEKLWDYLKDTEQATLLKLVDLDVNAWEALMNDDADMLFFGGPQPMKDGVNPQETLSSLRRAQLSKIQREKLAVVRQEEIDADKGVSTIDGFRNLLTIRFGSVVKAWKFLDNDGNGRLSRGEFYAVLRKIGFGGNAKQLWEALDDDNSGFVSLQELHPAAHKGLTRFFDLLHAKYGTGPLGVVNAWLNCFDLDGTGQIPIEPFTDGLKTLGYTGDPQRLFEWLQPDSAKPFLSLEDLDPDAFASYQRGDAEMYGIKREVRRATGAERVSAFVGRSSTTQAQRSEAIARKRRADMAKEQQKK
jgi:Ca2+-binding EF-hand superfamily protein